MSSRGSSPSPSGSLSHEPKPIITVIPEQLKIEVVLDKEVFLDLRLVNTSSSLCTFKVKTTARDRYLLRPTQDYIPPNSEKLCKIVMTKMKEYPDLANPKNLKDKFLVQSTTIEAEVPDLPAFWKKLETQHDPKNHHYMYAETKIKCKLQVPAKLRAQDAAARGEAQEAAAKANSSTTTPTTSGAASVPSTSEEAQRRTTNIGSNLEDMNLSSNTAIPHAVPSNSSSANATAVAPTTTVSNAATAASNSHPNANTNTTTTDSNASNVSTSSVSNANAGVITQQMYQAEKQKYAELMEFMVKTTQKFESERLEKESAEAKAQSAFERVKAAESLYAESQATIAMLKEQLARVQAQAASATVASSSASTMSEKNSSDVDENNSEGVRRRKTNVPDVTSLTAPLSTDSTGSSTAVTPIMANGSNMNMQLWQIALMALVFFVLGRILG